MISAWSLVRVWLLLTSAICGRIRNLKYNSLLGILNENRILVLETKSGSTSSAN